MITKSCQDKCARWLNEGAWIGQGWVDRLFYSLKYWIVGLNIEMLWTSTLNTSE